jgi:hypothetical protein
MSVQKPCRIHCHGQEVCVGSNEGIFEETSDPLLDFLVKDVDEVIQAR